MSDLLAVRAEELIYFNQERPTRHQGYYIQCNEIFYMDTWGSKTWEMLEPKMKELFPDCDPIEMAALVVIATSSDECDSAWASSQLEKRCTTTVQLGWLLCGYDDLKDECLMEDIQGGERR